MDFRNIDQEKKSIFDDLKEKAKEKSRIFKHEKYVKSWWTQIRDKYLAELESEFEFKFNNSNASRVE